MYQLFSELKEKYLNSKELLETNFRQLIEQLAIEIRNYCIEPLNKGKLKSQILDPLDEVNIGDHVFVSPNNKKDNEEDNEENNEEDDEDLADPSEGEEGSEQEEENDPTLYPQIESEDVDSTQMVKGTIIEILTYTINNKNEPRFRLKLDNGDIILKNQIIVIQLIVLVLHVF